MWLRRLRLALSLAFILGSTACVPIRSSDDELFTDPSLAFIEIGKTTKEEIDSKLTNQASKISTILNRQEYHDGDWWLYAQGRRKRDWLILVPYAGEVEGGVDYRLLLLKFDTRGIVSDYELSTPRNGECGQEGICRLASMYTVLAAAEEERVAKQFEVPANHCSAYIYGKAEYFGVSIYINDHSIGPIVNDEHFYLAHVAPGTHRLTGTSRALKDSTPIEFECTAGEMFFFNVEERSKNLFFTRYWIEAERQDEGLGREAVATRQLTLIHSIVASNTSTNRSEGQKLNLLRTVGLFDGLEKRGDVYLEKESADPFTGVRTTSYPDGGPAASIEFKNGLLDGVYSIWDEDGTLRRETRYEGGAVISDQVWCADGTPTQRPLLECKTH